MRRIMKLVFLAIAVLGLQSCSMRNNLTETPVPTETQTITVYFTDEAKFNVGTEPYEVAVNRPLPAGVDPVRAVLEAFFAGPTAEESAQGLVLVSSGFTGVGELTIEDGIARIHMEGKCANNGAAYSVANLIHKNLEQFEQISAIKIYDENGDNLDPDSDMSSMPYCLEP
ncbi:MAG: GerMN domain-containing protein [Anaerolineaceae bacterium]|nr:GerMN domain-containing protein [Anaerolineaceae bacterium]